jgi:hypothetical protein
VRLAVAPSARHGLDDLYLFTGFAFDQVADVDHANKAAVRLSVLILVGATARRVEGISRNGYPDLVQTRRGVYIRQFGPRLFVLPILPTPVSVLEPLFERRPVGHHLSHDRTFAGPWVLVLRREDW